MQCKQPRTLLQLQWSLQVTDTCRCGLVCQPAKMQGAPGFHPSQETEVIVVSPDALTNAGMA